MREDSGEGGPTAGMGPRRAWVPLLYLLLAAALVPWVVYLAVTLPDREVSENYRLAWVGFDVFLLGALARTAWLAWRRSPFVVNVASVTAALLLVDAWFDVATSTPGLHLLLAVVSAALVELPAAVLSMLIAARAQAEIARTGAIRAQRLPWADRDPLRVEVPAAQRPAAQGPEAGSRRNSAAGIAPPE